MRKIFLGILLFAMAMASVLAQAPALQMNGHLRVHGRTKLQSLFLRQHHRLL
jgi:hypothetical protein